MKGVVQDRMRVNGNTGGPPGPARHHDSWFLGETTPEKADHHLTAALQSD